MNCTLMEGILGTWKGSPGDLGHTLYFYCLLKLCAHLVYARIIIFSQCCASENKEKVIKQIDNFIQ